MGRFRSGFAAVYGNCRFSRGTQTLINETEQAMTAHDIAGEQKGGATGGLTDAFREARILSRRLNVIVLNEYAAAAQKLAAWAIASHLAAAPKREPKTPVAPK